MGYQLISVYEIARLCHEVNRAYCAHIGDHSQVAWEDAPEWQRASAIAGVRAVAVDPHRPPSASHESWYAHKHADGWVWGEVKDPEANPPTHPCMVPYSQLPPEQQLKDVLFLAIAKAALGFH